MFPTLNYLFRYLLGINLPLPVQTFGFFVAVAFWAAYQVFTSEFKRYEASGKIHAFPKQVTVGQPASAIDVVVNFLLGFLLGYKTGGIILHFAQFQSNPRGYLLSLQGNWIIGVFAGAAFGGWIYVDYRKKRLSQPVVITKMIHPYQLMGRIVLTVGVWGVIGSKLFDIIEHWDLFKYHPIDALLNSTGFTYYGGLIFGALSYLYVGYKHGMKLVPLADIGSLGMMLAYGVGRIGCALSGDGDWGVINRHVKPLWLHWLPDWAWSFKFPHNVINAGVTIPGCDGNFCNQLVYGVYPTSLYEAVLCIMLFSLMWILRKSIIMPGLMFCIYLMLNGGERLLIEGIRVNRQYAIWGISATQAQIIGGLMVLGGLYGISILYRKAKVSKNNVLMY